MLKEVVFFTPKLSFLEALQYWCEPVIRKFVHKEMTLCWLPGSFGNSFFPLMLLKVGVLAPDEIARNKYAKASVGRQGDVRKGARRR